MSDPTPAQAFVDEQLRKRSGAYRRLMDAVGAKPLERKKPSPPQPKGAEPKPVDPNQEGLFRW